jgi:hypothetical protein
LAEDGGILLYGACDIQLVLWGGLGVESYGRGIRLQVLWVAFFGSEYACLMVVLLMLFPVVCSCRPLHPRSGCRVGLVLGAAVQGSFELHYPNLRMLISWRVVLSSATLFVMALIPRSFWALELRAAAVGLLPGAR